MGGDYTDDAEHDALGIKAQQTLLLCSSQPAT